MKIDLVMWTKNGEKTLSQVLSAINRNIPQSGTRKRFIVDDDSNDRTTEIASSHGWGVIRNKGSGISDACNTALSNVEADCFASFEQDVLLAEDWWSRIPSLLRDKKTAVASGVRLPSKSKALMKINEYAIRKNATGPLFRYFTTLDNTIYKTKIIRQIGGFPKLQGGVGVDTLLAERLRERGFKWEVDPGVVSVHLKKLICELRSQYWYGNCKREVNQQIRTPHIFLRSLIRLLFSPLRGIEISIKQKCLSAAFVYPMIRCSNFFGICSSYFVRNH